MTALFKVAWKMMLHNPNTHKNDCFNFDPLKNNLFKVSNKILLKKKKYGSFKRLAKFQVWYNVVEACKVLTIEAFCLFPQG